MEGSTLQYSDGGSQPAKAVLLMRMSGNSTRESKNKDTLTAAKVEYYSHDTVLT